MILFGIIMMSIQIIKTKNQIHSILKHTHMRFLQIFADHYGPRHLIIHFDIIHARRSIYMGLKHLPAYNFQPQSPNQGSVLMWVSWDK